MERLENIKLVALDIDGTLIDDNLNVSKNTINKINELMNRGINIALVSGRPYKAAVLIRDRINENIPIVAYNGGIVSIGKERMFSAKIPLNSAKQIIKYGERYNLYVKVYIDDVLHIKEADELSLKFCLNHNINYKVVGKLSENIKDDANMIIIYYDKDIDGLIDQELEDIEVYITTSVSNSLDIVPNDVSKGKGLKMIADGLNINRDNILALGNSLNDLDMLEYAGIGIAMKNSDISLLRKWDSVSKYTNNEEGVYHILKMI